MLEHQKIFQWLWLKITEGSYCYFFAFYCTQNIWQGVTSIKHKIKEHAVYIGQARGAQSLRPCTSRAQSLRPCTSPSVRSYWSYASVVIVIEPFSTIRYLFDPDRRIQICVLKLLAWLSWVLHELLNRLARIMLAISLQSWDYYFPNTFTLILTNINIGFLLE